ncbi:MAG: hypothetical protein II309_04880 [Bacilli bacterium]|nr:hypothetical protein [Bacilli bacterium]
MKKIFKIALIFAVCFLAHNMYDWFDNSVTSIFFPVNESIWEHMKIIFTSTIIVSFFEYLRLKKTGLLYHNFWFSNIFSAFLSIPLYLVLFVPVYNVIGENMFFSIGLMLVVIIAVVYMAHYLSTKKEIRDMTLTSLIFLSLVYIGFGYLTYYPAHNGLFYDTTNNMYGINTYVLRD